MSCNIDDIRYINGTGPLGLSVLAREHLENLYRDVMPESNFITETDGEVLDAVWWCGEGSESSYDDFLTALKSTTGEAQLLLTWECGDSHTGLFVSNGSVVEYEIVMSFGEVYDE